MITWWWQEKFICASLLGVGYVQISNFLDLLLDVNVSILCMIVVIDLLRLELEMAW
jgi:hypothetical protein